MSATQPQRGFTLVELLVTLAITSFLLLASAPYLNDWTYSRQVKDANSKLRSAFGQARAMALRNPNAVKGNAAVAAGVRLDTGGATSTLFICAGEVEAEGERRRRKRHQGMEERAPWANAPVSHSPS